MNEEVKGKKKEAQTKQANKICYQKINDNSASMQFLRPGRYGGETIYLSVLLKVA